MGLLVCKVLGKPGIVGSCPERGEDSQNLHHSAKATYYDVLSPPSLGRLATGWPHIYIIVHPNTKILPD
eukprot:598913-Pleurochrysis_carterae.AAC.1